MKKTLNLSGTWPRQRIDNNNWDHEDKKYDQKQNQIKTKHRPNPKLDPHQYHTKAKTKTKCSQEPKTKTEHKPIQNPIPKTQLR